MTPEELLQQYNIPYISSSTNLKCRCLNPMHNDSSPSFSIEISTGRFQCFGCKIKGNFNALHKLVTGEYYKEGVTDYWNYVPFSKTKIQKKKEVSNIKIIGKLHDPLKNKEVREYLRSIGIISDQFIKDREITYSVYTEMIAEHLLDTPDIRYTQMRYRICTPIYDEGKLVNVEGRKYRSVDIANKEIPKVMYVKGGSADVLYNWNSIDINSDVVLVEGLKDYYKVYNVYTNVVPLFRNLISPKQAKLLNTVKGNIIGFLDNDDGGFGKYDEHGELACSGMVQSMDEVLDKEFKICFPPIKGNDPNDCSLSLIEKLISKAEFYNEQLIRDLFPTKISNW